MMEIGWPGVGLMSGSAGFGQCRAPGPRNTSHPKQLHTRSRYLFSNNHSINRLSPRSLSIARRAKRAFATIRPYSEWWAAPCPPEIQINPTLVSAPFAAKRLRAKKIQMAGPNLRHQSPQIDIYHSVRRNCRGLRRDVRQRRLSPAAAEGNNEVHYLSLKLPLSRQ
jgi:hypothetical protein